MPILSGNHSKQEMNSAKFGHGSKRFLIVKAFNLIIPFSHQVSFVQSFRLCLILYTHLQPTSFFSRGVWFGVSRCHWPRRHQFRGAWQYVIGAAVWLAKMNVGQHFSTSLEIKLVKARCWGDNMSYDNTSTKRWSTWYINYCQGRQLGGTWWKRDFHMIVSQMMRGMCAPRKARWGNSDGNVRLG